MHLTCAVCVYPWQCTGQAYSSQRRTLSTLQNGAFDGVTVSDALVVANAAQQCDCVAVCDVDDLPITVTEPPRNAVSCALIKLFESIGQIEGPTLHNRAMAQIVASDVLVLESLQLPVHHLPDGRSTCTHDRDCSGSHAPEPNSINMLTYTPNDLETSESMSTYSPAEQSALRGVSQSRHTIKQRRHSCLCSWLLSLIHISEPTRPY